MAGHMGLLRKPCTIDEGLLLQNSWTRFCGSHANGSPMKPSVDHACHPLDRLVEAFRTW